MLRWRETLLPPSLIVRPAPSSGAYIPRHGSRVCTVLGSAGRAGGAGTPYRYWPRGSRPTLHCQSPGTAQVEASDGPLPTQPLPGSPPCEIPVSGERQDFRTNPWPVDPSADGAGYFLGHSLCAQPVLRRSNQEELF